MRGSPVDGERGVVYVGATGLHPAARAWLHLHDPDPEVGRAAALHPDAAPRAARRPRPAAAGPGPAVRGEGGADRAAGGRWAAVCGLHGRPAALAAEAHRDGEIAVYADRLAAHLRAA